MSIPDRLVDADILAQHKRHDGALLSVLVAVAATSRRRYPKTPRVSDRDAFTQFVSDEMLVLTSGSVANFNVRVPGSESTKRPDGMMPLGECLYEFVRCNLAHEASLPDNVQFIDSDHGNMSIDINDDRIQLSRSFVHNLRKAVIHAPENSDHFPDIAQTPDDVIAWHLFGPRRDNASAVEYMRLRSERAKELTIES